MVDTLWGYAVFAVGMLILLALFTAALAWWLRWAARRLFLWVPDEKKRTNVAKRNSNGGADDETVNR
jgi:hypothetical protein